VARKIGAKDHKPTDENRRLVKMLAAVGARVDDIGTKLGISHDTVLKYYRQELEEGRIDANAQVAQTLFQQAKSGNTAAMIFWMKTRAGWKEKTTHELVGADGGPIQSATVLEVVGVEAKSRTAE
jgi:transposase